eukprot:TRINITY_DN3852_c0_g1_i7.p3 TRINITY_DN3852_c0_g1~~TRINITY_DN3852_c0_g1_i7.p3  ORF type:complete len:100 (-),score=25.57 TRINITY_DN3852_c0_g1_i7:195-494(-)
MEKVSENEGKATVHPEITRFKDQFYLPLAGNISRKERKERLRQFGHLNFTPEESEAFAESARTRTKVEHLNLGNHCKSSSPEVKSDDNSDQLQNGHDSK